MTNNGNGVANALSQLSSVHEISHPRKPPTSERTIGTGYIIPTNSRDFAARYHLPSYKIEDGVHG